MFGAHSKFAQARAGFSGAVLALAISSLCLAQGATSTQTTPSLSSASKQTVAVGPCLPSLQTYNTISDAVAAVSSGATILVCPGNYPEQVVITQPLTLRGVQSQDPVRPVVTVPSGGLTQSVISPANGKTMFFQIMVKDTESGAVNIEGIGVDGTNNLVTGGSWLEGIYYQNSSGVLSGVATYDQAASKYGYGILMEGTTSPAKTFTVNESSVHDFLSEGIRVYGSPEASLTVNIQSNSVISYNSLGSKSVSGGIDLQGSATGSISGNKVITRPATPGNSSAKIGIAFQSNTIVSGNTVDGWFNGIWLLADSNTVRSNTVSLAVNGIVVGGTKNDVEHNLLLNNIGTTNNGAAISFNCTGTGNTVTNNVINEASSGIINQTGTNTTAPNSYSNVTAITSSTCK